MQTRAVINKIRWIRSQLSDELEEWLFSYSTGKRDADVFGKIMDATRFTERLSTDAAAAQTLRAFDLDALVEHEKSRKWLDQVTSTRSRLAHGGDEEEEGSVARCHRTP